MTQKELNAGIAKIIGENPFYRSNVFCRYFSDDFTMDIPSAPPGMPTHYSTWEAERCFEWLNRSVRKWEGSIRKFYPTPDPDIFWIEGQIEADVFWGEQDGHFSSETFMRIEFSNGKVKYMNWRFHTWAMLQAAGKRVHAHCLELPVNEKGNVDHFDEDFLIDLDDPAIAEYMEHPVYGDLLLGDGNSQKKMDVTPEAIYQRRQINIYQFAAGVDREKYRHMEILAPNYRKFAHFTNVPGTKGPIDKEYESIKKAGGDPLNTASNTETARRYFAWNKLCSPWMYRDPRSKFYATDDPNVIFVEMNSHGPGCWKTRSVTTGHYKENYLVKLTLDDIGRLVRFEEILDPLNMMNSNAADVPNFPYYH